jgi:hypothetical protein
MMKEYENLKDSTKGEQPPTEISQSPTTAAAAAAAAVTTATHATTTSHRHTQPLLPRR